MVKSLRGRRQTGRPALNSEGKSFPIWRGDVAWGTMDESEHPWEIVMLPS